MKKFVNLSNHGSGAWGEAQTSAAKVYGDIVDVPYPQVPTDLDENQFLELVESTVASVLAHEPAMVMCQGEMTTCFSIVSRLKAAGIPVVAAVSERKAVEKVVDGQTVKTAVFEFKGFRTYI